MLRWTDNSTCEDSLLTMPGHHDSSTRYHYILPSFYKLLNYLQQEHRDFTIIFRTYGMDAKNVLRSIAHALKGNHPSIDTSWDISINFTPGKMKRFNDVGTIQMELPERVNGVFKPAEIIDNEAEMYRILSNFEGIHAFVDDFETWQNHKYESSYGKPFWIDLDDKKTHHILFDDNIRVTDVDSIVDLRMRTGHHTAKDMQEVCLVQADLLNNINNQDYFVNKVKLCEQNYEKFLHNHSSGVHQHSTEVD